MELSEMEKRLIFQTEGYGKSEVIYELRMCLPYIPDTAKRKVAADLVRKLDAMPEKRLSGAHSGYSEKLPASGRT